MSFLAVFPLIGTALLSFAGWPGHFSRRREPDVSFRLFRTRRGILAELRAEPEPFVPTVHRTRRFLSNPLVLFFILLTAGLMAKPFLQA